LQNSSKFPLSGSPKVYQTQGGGGQSYPSQATLQLRYKKSLVSPIGMKTERKRTELSGAIFVFIFLCGSRNGYRNTGNKNKNGYFRKQKWNEYGTNTDKKRMIIGTKRPPESCSKTQAS
jgi:hypothetical protein